VTADALYAQREHATYLVAERGAGYTLIVKANQPNLFTAPDALNWDTPSLHTKEETGHGRIERRTIRVQPAPDGITFPYVAQVFLIERYVTDTGSGTNTAIAVLGITRRDATAQTPSRSPPGHANTGASRTPCTTSETSPTAKTPPKTAPTTDPSHGQHPQPRHRHPPPGRENHHRRRTPPHRT
jgi:hypothetical protein